MIFQLGKFIIVPFITLITIAVNILSGCGKSDNVLEGETFAVFDTTGAEEDLFSIPFPTDLHLNRETSRVDITSFPNPDDVSLLSDYVTAANKVLNGFGTNTPVYFRFSATLNQESLPDAISSMKGNSPLFLVDVDETSPGYGRRIPVDSMYIERGGKYHPPHMLVLKPHPGFPLRPSTTYAAVVLKSLGDKDGVALLSNDNLKQYLKSDAYLPLITYLNEKNIHMDDIAAATVFTTQDILRELLGIRKALRDESFGVELFVIEDMEYCSQYDKDYYLFIRGTFLVPNFQAGYPPYESEGDFLFKEGNTPILQRTEGIRFALTVPKGVEPEEGWPVVTYAHGTGGHYMSFVTSGVAEELCSRGLAVIGIDQPMHGPRGWGLQKDHSRDDIYDYRVGPDFNVELASFNFLNPYAGRCNFRQSVVDSFSLINMIDRYLKVDPGIFSDGPIYFDRDRILFMGHSHGGLTGAMLLALEPDILGGVLSGAGGGMSLTVLERKNPIDIASLLTMLTGIRYPEELSLFHPTLCLIQMLVDVTDPINYARYYLNPLEGSPKSVLLTEGLKDTYTPPSTTEALATAAGLPLASYMLIV